MAKAVAKSRWTKHNQNPKGLKTGDCVIRAFSFATGKTWEQTLTDLFEIALEMKTVPNFKEAYIAYADKLGLKKGTIRVVKGQKRPTPQTFAEDHPTGTYILRLAHHLVAVKDGNYVDAWDCGAKGVYTYWQVPEGGVK